MERTQVTCLHVHAHAVQYVGRRQMYTQHSAPVQAVSVSVCLLFLLFTLSVRPGVGRGGSAAGTPVCSDPGDCASALPTSKNSFFCVLLCKCTPRCICGRGHDTVIGHSSYDTRHAAILGAYRHCATTDSRLALRLPALPEHTIRAAIRTRVRGRARPPSYSPRLAPKASMIKYSGTRRCQACSLSPCPRRLRMGHTLGNCRVRDRCSFQ